MTAYWWVNHKQTYAEEVGGGYIWSPKSNKDGGRNQFYENMKLVRPGDVVFSYADTHLRAMGNATGAARTATRPPEFGKVGDQWDSEGWMVPVDFEILEVPLRPADHAQALAPLLPPKYSPIRADGNGNQGAYLSSVPKPLADALLDLLGRDAPQEPLDRVSEAEIRNRTDIGSTKKLQLVMARVGQGQYRKNLVQFEPACRLTGVTDERFLVASHIKAWSLSDDFEKIDGNNGLLLSPHVDRLFDRGYISFADDGSLLVKAPIPVQVLSAWGINEPAIVRPFRPEQAKYLAFHRKWHGFDSLGTGSPTPIL